MVSAWAGQAYCREKKKQPQHARCLAKISNKVQRNATYRKQQHNKSQQPAVCVTRVTRNYARPDAALHHRCQSGG